MNTPLIMRGVAVFVTAIVLLILLWLFIPSMDQARSAVDNKMVARPAQGTAPPPDPRWLSLIREEPLRASSAPQATSLSINLDLTTGYVAGRTPLPFAVVISITRGGTHVGYAAVTPLPDGDDYFYLTYMSCSYPYAAGGGGSYYCWQAGDVIWVAQVGNLVSMTIPSLTALAAAETDRVYGMAPVSPSVTVYVFPFATPDVLYTQTVTADATGNYTATWAPALDVRPRDNGYVMYAQDPNRRAYVRFVAPFLRAWLNGQEVSGLAAPNASVLITLTDVPGTPWLTAYAYADRDGTFQLDWYYWWKFRLRPLRSGDRVIASASGQTFSTNVVTVTAQADLASGQVRGEAPADQPVDVLRFAGPLQSDYDYLWTKSPAGQTTVTATAQGHYTAGLLLSRADYGAVVATLPDGNQTYVRFALPYLGVNMGEGNLELPGASIGMGGPPPPFDYIGLWGQVADMAAPITIAIQGPSGYLKDVRFATSAGNGYFYHVLSSQPLTLGSGDVITVTTPLGVQAALTLPQLTARADPVSDTIAGLAPPGLRLAVTVSVYPPYELPRPPALNGAGGGGGDYGRYTVIVTSTAQGEYRADFDGLVDIEDVTSVEVSLTTPEGHLVIRAFRAALACRVMLDYIQVGGNVAYLTRSGNCYSGAVRLRDANGQLKAVAWYNAPVRFVDDGSGRPVAIQPGDTIEADVIPMSHSNVGSSLASTRVVTATVPTLTVALDAAANALAGEALPGASLTLDLYRESSFLRQLTTTASAQGVYSVSLAGFYSLEPGDRVRVWDDTPGRPRFYADNALPLLQAILYENKVAGWMSPLTPYTISLETSRPVTAQVNGYADTNGSLGAYLAAVQPADTIVLTTPRQVIRLMMPLLSAQVDRSAAIVFGQAPPQARLRVELSPTFWPLPQPQAVTATAGGVYTASFPELAYVSNATGKLIYFNEEGHQVHFRFSTVRWAIVLDAPCMSGNAGVMGQAVTVTLAAGDGALKDVRPAWTSSSGDYGLCFTQTVQPGDRLSLIRAVGVMTLTVPELTAQHEWGRQALEGQAVAHSPIAATFQTEPGWYSYDKATRHTWADADGRYGIDTSDLSLRLRYVGYVVMTDSVGNTIQRNFTIRGYQTFMPLVTRNEQSVLRQRNVEHATRNERDHGELRQSPNHLCRSHVHCAFCAAHAARVFA